MSAGFGTALVAMIVFIAFIALVAFILPYSYNHHLKAEQTHSSYCIELHKNIDADKQDIQLQNLTIQEIYTYAQQCSSS